MFWPFPKSLKLWIRKRVRGIARQTLFEDLPEALPKALPGALTFQALPTAALKYVPYKHQQDSYLIADADAAALDLHEGLPVPPESLWNAFGESRATYIATGAAHVRTMRDALEASGGRWTDVKRMLDFGCGAGRMLRHLRNEADRIEMWGVDISAEHIYWCIEHLEPPFHFVTVTTVPHLPFSDSTFDLTFAGSVFTHLEDLSRPWLLELARVIRPGGWLYVTIHDEHTFRLWIQDKTNPIPAKLRASPHFERARKGFGMLVVDRDKQSQVFFSQKLFAKHALPFFDVRHVVPEAYGSQTGVMLQRRPV